MASRQTKLNKTVRLWTSYQTTTGALAVPADVATAPTADGTDGYIKTPRYGESLSDNNVIIQVAGTDAANEDGKFTLYGVDHVDAGVTNVYHHTPLLYVTYTLGALATGDSDTYWADTLAADVNIAGATIHSNQTALFGADAAARILMDYHGYAWLYGDVDVDAGSTASASANLFFRFI